MIESLHKLLQKRDLSFSEFMAIALYEPGSGYYASGRNPASKEGDFVTSPSISPVFSYALARLVSEFLRCTEDGVFALVDIGCGDGTLLAGILGNLDSRDRSRIRAVGIDRSISRVPSGLLMDENYRFSTELSELDRWPDSVIISNELYDAVPFDRFVMTATGLRELTVSLRAEGELGWSDRPATEEQSAYFLDRAIELAEGQYADVTAEWGRLYGDIAASQQRGMIVTIDYGFPARSLFDIRIRRYGTAAAFTGHLVSRDLLADPGSRDLTAHINFSDLIAAGEAAGQETVALLRQAAFLLALGAAGHPLFEPVDPEESTGGLADALERTREREAAKSLILPDGIGEEMKALVQMKGVPCRGWRFSHDTCHVAAHVAPL